MSVLNSKAESVLFLNQEISPLLSMEAMAFVTEDRKLTQEATYPNTYIFDLFGGVDVSSCLILLIL